jgi:geranylgeranyl diphosphate synthase type II
MADAASGFARPLTAAHPRRPDGAPISPGSGALNAYLASCRELVLREIDGMMPRVRYGQRLYELMGDYPLRGGKALRPALCIATCRAMGGYLEAVLRTAAAIELYHNAFLVHDDVEDRSELRRAEPTLHRKYGVPIAVNVGDGMLALSMASLLDNTEIIGVGKTLRVLDVVSRMARESAEGQMIELDWIAQGSWTLTDDSYIRMVYKKTTWYSFITPVRVGAIAGGASQIDVDAFSRFATLLGVAFQIQDDLLNLIGDSQQYGKETAGDLWEGKHTLILIHAIRCASETEQGEALRILAKPRLAEDGLQHHRQRIHDVTETLRTQGQLSADACLRLRSAAGIDGTGAIHKSAQDVEFLLELIERYDGIGYASAVAERHAARAVRSFDGFARRLAPSAHLDFLRALAEFVIRRTR